MAREASGNGCPIIPPGGSPVPHQAAVYEAVSAGAGFADVLLPDKADGYNRTVSVNGLCNNAVTNSSAFTCQRGGGEFYAGLLASNGAAPVSLSFGSATCQMTGISIAKTNAATPFQAELRLQFEGCTGSAAGVENAAVVVGIRKEVNPPVDIGLLAWSQEVCKTVTTTTGAPVQVSQQTDARVTEVGAGRCDASERKQIPNITKETACKLECIGSASAAQSLGGTGCTGFAFNAAASGATCITYSGAVLQATSSSGWKCFNVSFQNSSYAKATPAPVAPPQDSTQLLNVKQALGQTEMAYLHEISPPKDSPDCFKPMWWFKPEDKLGNEFSVAVKAADWEDFMSLLPEANKTTSVVSAPMVLDRVLFNTCTNSSGWGQECSVVAAPAATQATQCRSAEIWSAIVAGVITSVLTWLLVAIVFKVCQLGRRASSIRYGEYERLKAPVDGKQGEKIVCDCSVVALLSLVALVGSAGSCWVSMQFLTTVFRKAECYNINEFFIVILCVCISTALTIMIFLWHMTGFSTSHPLVHDTVGHMSGKKQAPQVESTLMLVSVEEGSKVGSVLDSFHMKSQGGSVVGFTPGNLNTPIQSPNNTAMSTN